MKKYLSILAFSCLTLCSCDNFLDLTPQSVLTPENAYEKPEDWQQTLYAAYGTLQEVFVGKYTITLTEFGTDEVIPFDMGWAAYSQLHYYTFSASHEFLDNHYRLCYEGIKRCNAVIDMPSDVDEVYTLITQDMEAALGLPTSWPNAQDKGRATSYAAQALLARIYLQWGKPEEALKYCRMLEGKFKLYDNLKDIFDPKNKNQEYENIFEIQFKHSGSWGLEGSIQHSYWGPRNVGGPTNFGGWGGFGPTQYLYDSYDNNDKRKKAFFITEYAGVTQTPPSSGKFWDAETGNVIEDDNLNFTMIRYADVLLMKAEALNSIDDTSNDKYDALNEVRGRAGLTSITAADNLNKEQFAEVVLEERLHELCCEHLRRWDLIRFGKLGEYMKDHAGVTIQPYHVLYPIPQAAVDANDAITENNEGY